MRASVLAVVALGLLMVAEASCPNQCSGHGRCGANDKCECYTQTNTAWGNRAMYTGADCSQRTCPLGFAHDAIANYKEQVDQILYTVNKDGAATIPIKAYLSQNLLLAGPVVTFNVKVITTSAAAGVAGTGTFVWKYAADSIYSNEIAFATRLINGAVGPTTDVMLLDPPQTLLAYPQATNPQTETGIRVYFVTGVPSVGDIFTITVSRPSGGHWIAGNDNTVHQMTECSARGLCDAASGKCKCFSAYGGEACQRTVCPSDCSGHGICQDQQHFRTDAVNNVEDWNAGVLTGYQSDLDKAYFFDAVDGNKQMGCKCDNGYRGPDCSLIECPSGSDPLNTLYTEEYNLVSKDCSGRGICDYGVGQCKCFKGYFGERCETQTNFF